MKTMTAMKRGFPCDLVGAGARCAPFWAITAPKRTLGEKALDSNVGTKKTPGKWVSHRSLVV